MNRIALLLFLATISACSGDHPGSMDDAGPPPPDARTSDAGPGLPPDPWNATYRLSWECLTECAYDLPLQYRNRLTISDTDGRATFWRDTCGIDCTESSVVTASVAGDCADLASVPIGGDATEPIRACRNAETLRGEVEYSGSPSPGVARRWRFTATFWGDEP